MAVWGEIWKGEEEAMVEALNKALMKVLCALNFLIFFLHLSVKLFLCPQCHS